VGSDGSAGLRAAKLPRRKFHRWRLSMMYSSGVVGSPVSWSIGAGPSRSWSPTAGVTLRVGLPEVITLILQARRE
jgi:hypothetical protein